MNSKNIKTGKLDCFMLNFMTSNNHAVITARKRSLGQYFYTCLSFCSQGGSTSVHAGIPPPREQAPLGAGLPPGLGTPSRGAAPPPPPAQSMLGDTVNAQAVRILLECNLVDGIYSQVPLKWTSLTVFF